MAASKLINRYANTLLEIAEEKNLAYKFFEEATHFIHVCHDNRDFSNLLKNPTFTSKLKFVVIKQIFTESMDPLMISFIRVVIQHKREMWLKDIFKDYLRLYKEKMGILEAEVITAVPVENDFLHKFSDLIQKISGFPKVEMKNIVDEKIIGGFVLHFEDKILDASVAKKLKQAKTRTI